MAKQTLVSVVMPAYKVEPYIAQAIESVLAQTMPDWELIIVDDCSPDKTAQVVEQYLGDSRIKFLRNERNLGAAGSRNRALEVAQGEWIALLDADDWYEPPRLERLLGLAEAMNAKYVIDLRRRVYEGESQTKIANLSRIYPNPTQPVRYDVYQAVRGHIVEQPLMLHDIIRKEQLRYADLPKGNDYFFQLRVLYRAGFLAVLPEPFYNHRAHPESITHRYRSDTSKTVMLYDKILSLPEVCQDPRLREAVMADYRRELGYQKLNDFRRALRRLSIGDMIRTYREAPAVLPLFLKGLPDTLRRHLRPNVR